MTIGETIQDERKHLGLSQEELGELIGVSRQAVSKWELDTALPDLDNLVALSRAFSISTDELLGNEELPRATLAGEPSVAPRTDGWNKFVGFVERNWHRLGYLLILGGGASLWREVLAWPRLGAKCSL